MQTTDWIALIDSIAKLALIPLAAAGVVYLARLFGLKLTAQQELELKTTVERGLFLAEEEGLKALKDHGAKISGREKLAIAVTKAREFSSDGLVKYRDDQLEEIAQAELARVRPLLSSPPPPESSGYPTSMRPPAVPRVD